MMNTITILAMLAILSGATLSITGFSAMSSVVAQEMIGDNATTSGNITGGNVTGDNTTEASGTISGLGAETMVTNNPSVQKEYEWERYK